MLPILGHRDLPHLKATKIAVPNGGPNGTDHPPTQLPPYSPPRAHSKPQLSEKIGSKRGEQPHMVGDFEWGPWTINGEF